MYINGISNNKLVSDGYTCPAMDTIFRVGPPVDFRLQIYMTWYTISPDYRAVAIKFEVVSLLAYSS